MAARTFYSTFNLHETGVSASLNARAKALSEQERLKLPFRGSAATGTVLFTLEDRDLSGVDSNWRIQLISPVGTISRDVAVASVASQVITIAGANFAEDAGNVESILYLPPTAALIVTDPKKRGTGTAGFDEFIDSVFAELGETFPTALVDLQYINGVLEQVMVVNDAP